MDIKKNQSILDKTENLLSFQNVYAGANLTLLSLPKLLLDLIRIIRIFNMKKNPLLMPFKSGFYTSWFCKPKQ